MSETLSVVCVSVVFIEKQLDIKITFNEKTYCGGKGGKKCGGKDQ